MCPTRTSPFSSSATTDGVNRDPSSFAMTLGSLPSMIATTEFVVPRSMPMILPMTVFPRLPELFAGQPKEPPSGRQDTVPILVAGLWRIGEDAPGRPARLEEL